MNEKLKLYLYAVLILLGIWFGWGFYSNFESSTREKAQAASEEMVEATTNTVAVSETTNGPAGETNKTNQSAGIATNTNAQAVVSGTNAPTNQISASPAQKKHAAATADEPPKKKSGSMIGYLAGLIGVIVCIGLLAAHDVSQFMGRTAVDFIFDEEGEEHRDPEYERAEKIWANGQALEAIQIMRDYLKEHPSKLYVAFRIAEIYEKDLNNNLAAALEYEEILKQKLPPERWGWAAIHLCNLYSKTGQPAKSAELLERVANEYPDTAAARKARSRLGLPEPEEAGSDTSSSGGAEQPPSSSSNLPPGFRPKK